MVHDRSLRADDRHAWGLGAGARRDADPGAADRVRARRDALARQWHHARPRRCPRRCVRRRRAARPRPATRLRYARFAAGGLTLDLDEPARFYFNAGTSDRWIQVHLDGTGVHYAYRPAATVRREIKRRLDHGRRVRLRYSLNAYDADGNFDFNPGILEITR